MSDDPIESLRLDFLLDAHERLERVEQVLLGWSSSSAPEREAGLEELRRDVHTLKGNAGMMGFAALQQAAHRLEDQLGKRVDSLQPETALLALDVLARGVAALDRGEALDDQEAEAADGDPAAATAGSAPRSHDGVRVPFSELDALVDSLSEMVVLQNQLGDSFGRARRHVRDEIWEPTDEARVALDKVLRSIRERILRLRMVPLRRLFGHLHRIAHDQGHEQGVEIAFEVSGGETPIDKGLLEVASEALGHLVRNAAVHGIEAPEERRRRDKPPAGRIAVSAVSDANGVCIEVADDGAGIDREKLLAAARARGLELPADDLATLVFHPGLSTSSDADLSSGRGVGVSAAHDATRRMGGSLTVQTEAGVGTRFRLRLPLSVSMVRALLFAADGEEYALPLSAVQQSTWFRYSEVHRLDGQLVLPWRDAVLPILDIGQTFATAPGLRTQGTLLVIDHDGERRGIVVDEVTGIRDIVMKEVGQLLGDAPGILGSTIVGDGRVVLILDPPGLFAWNRSLEAAA